MRLQKLLPLFIISFSLASRGDTQPFIKNSLEHFKILIHDFVYARDIRTEYRKTEYFILFAEIDSNGRVTDIHMMSDEKNRDSAYSAFKKLTPVALKDWQSKEYKNKVIVLPVYCEGIDTVRSKSNQYLMYGPYRPIYIPKECSGLKQRQDYVLIHDLVYLWPSSSTSH